MDVKALTLKHVTYVWLEVISILYYYYYCWITGLSITSNIVKAINHIQQFLIKHSIQHLLIKKKCGSFSTSLQQLLIVLQKNISDIQNNSAFIYLSYRFLIGISPYVYYWAWRFIQHLLWLQHLVVNCGLISQHLLVFWFIINTTIISKVYHIHKCKNLIRIQHPLNILSY